MAIICRELGLLFIQVPATACSVVGIVLERDFGGESVGPKHATATRLVEEGVMGEAELRRCHKVATVRNPFDRLVSEYQRLAGPWVERELIPRIRDEAGRRRKLREMHRARAQGFDRWVRRRVRSRCFPEVALAAGKAALRRRPVGDYLSAPFPKIGDVDRVLHYERLEAELSDLLQELGAHRGVTLPRNNPTPGKEDYRGYYSPRLRRLVERHWGPQMRRLGYTFDGLTTELTSAP